MTPRDDDESGLESQSEGSSDDFATDLPVDSDAYATEPPSGNTELPVENDEFETLLQTQDDAERGIEQRPVRLRFRKLKDHAEGGLGRVSVAQDNELQRQVAVKEIKESYADLAESRARFIFEAEVTGRLEHPGVVPVYALGKHADGRPYYAMRFVTGESLAESVKQLHAIADRESYDRKLRDLLNRLVSVCNTIHYAHSRGYVHRDLKPANIMLGEYGETLVVDWGLAKNFGASTQEHSELSIPPEGELGDSAHSSSAEGTHDGSVVGTPWYMPPEQAAGAIDEISPLSDIYSLGATLYQILTGFAPLQNQNLKTMDEVLQRVRSGDIESPIALNSTVPKPLNTICKAAMQVVPQNRYSTARELAADLENYLADERVSVVEETIWDQAGRWTRKHRGVANSLGISLLVISAIATYAYLITQNSLTRTERLLERSKAEQKFDRIIADEKQRIFSTGLAANEIPISDSVVKQSTTVLDQIEQLRQIDETVGIDDPRRKVLLETWEQGLKAVAGLRMNRSVHQLLEDQLSRLESQFPWKTTAKFETRVAALRELVAENTGRWYPLDLKDLQQLGFSKTNDGYLPDVAGIDEPILLRESEPGNQFVSAQFSGQWNDASGLGVVLNQTENTSYQFVIASESYDPLYGLSRLPTIAEASKSKNLMMFITRHNAGEAVVLRRLPLVSINTSRLSTPPLIGTREAGTTLTLNFGSESMSFDDPLPLPTATPGAVGVICPSPAQVVDVAVEVQRDFDSSASLVSDIEKGDQAFSLNRNDEALRFYQRVPNSIEAMFKQSLILAEKEPSSVFDLLYEIVFLNSVEGVEDSRERQFYLYAGVRLLLEYMSREDGQVQASVVMAKLNSNFTMDDVQRLIPENEKTTFGGLLLKPGKRSRMVFDNKAEVEDMQSVIDTYGAMFSNNEVWMRLARWRLADAYQAQWGEDPVVARQGARSELRRLLNEVEAILDAGGRVDDLELTTLIRDCVWLELLDRREAEAMNLVSQHLPGERSDTPKGMLPLLIDRARIHHAQGEIQKAQADLEYFIGEIDPRNPPPSLHHTHFAEACGILGIIHRDKGELEQAQEYWALGRRRNWVEWFPDPSTIARQRGWDMILESEDPEPYLQGQSDGYTPVEMKSFLDVTLAGSGMDDRAIRKIIHNSERIPKRWIKIVAEKGWSCDRGRAIGEAMVLHQLSMRDCNVEAVAMIFYTAVLHISFDGEKTLAKHAEFDPLLFDLCYRLIGVFQAGKMSMAEMRFILAGFTGDWNAKSFAKLAAKMEDQALASGLALVIARMVAKQTGNTETCRKILEQYVEPFQNEIPPIISTLAKSTLMELRNASL